ncbi:hypothetical protein ACE09Y_10395 [Raphidiopsis sp. BLCC-F218]
MKLSLSSDIFTVLPLPILLIVVGSVSSCTPRNFPDPAKPSPTSQPFSTPLSPDSSSQSPSNTDKNIPVTLYTSDAQCQDYIPQVVKLSPDQIIDQSIGKILEQQTNADFSIVSYRLNISNEIATIDLRVAPDSSRQIASLSNCEQFALFGSIRKTLTSNLEWNIKDVRFTQGGKEIIF